MRRHLALWLASGCYLGLIPGAPGTYASVATTLVFAAVARGSARILPELHLSAVCLLALSGTLAAADVARRRAVEDPQEVVVDEIAGQLLALWLVPATLANLALATVLFRIFDIWKPFPLRSLERLPRGVGVMADDLGAGIYANCVLQLANRVFGL